MLDIKPCPFCGQKPHINYVFKSVECLNVFCAVQPATWAFDTAEEAVNEWNARNRDEPK